MLQYSLSIFAWLLDLFNAPPRAAMTFRQKIGRILFVSGALIVLCILTTMATAIGIFMVERTNRMLAKIPDLWTTAAILFTGIAVNVLCVYFLFQVKKL